MLTGTELLAKVKEFPNASKSEIVRECGYTSTKKDGSERLNFTAFYEALLEAKGLSVGHSSKGTGRGRSLSYVTRVQFNGNLLIGKAYTAQLGLQPGDEFEIKLGKKQIRLIPLNETVMNISNDMEDMDHDSMDNQDETWMDDEQMSNDDSKLEMAS